MFRNGPTQSRLQWLTVISALFLCAHAQATNLTEQFQLCKSDACIENIKETHNLTKVDAIPTHAAFQPGWPETLYTLSLSIVSIFTAFLDQGEGFFELFTKIFIPFVLMVHWLVGWGIALKNAKTGGYVSVNLFMGFLNLVGIMECQDSMGCVTGLMAIFQLLAIGLQFIGTIAIVHERWKQLGTVAYSITDSKGCLPHNGFAYLERGARSHAFRGVQTAQCVWAYAVLILLLIALGSIRTRGEEGDKEFALAVKVAAALNILLIGIPILIYQSVIAAQGRPVVLSGNCMLVELDPKLGFWDSRIENWWKVLSMLGGL